MKVILLQEAKLSLIALEYDDLIFNLLSQENKQDLLTARRRIISKKVSKESPFIGQVIATQYQDHYIKSNYRIFKGHQDDCVNFLKFYVDKGEFQPTQFVFITKYSNVVKVKSLEEFLKIVS